MSRSPTDPRRPDEPAGDGGGGNAPAGWFALVGIGFEFAVTILVMGLIGWYADRHWNTSPWLLVTGLAFGVIVGMWMLINAARKAFKE